MRMTRIKRRKRKQKGKRNCNPLKSFVWENQVTSGSGAEILNEPWVWYSHNIPLLIKMLNQNMTQRGTQATILGVLIGRYSHDSQHGKPIYNSANVGCSFFRCTNDDLRNHKTDANIKHGQGKTTNLHCTAILGATPHKEI